MKAFAPALATLVLILAPVVNTQASTSDQQRIQAIAEATKAQQEIGKLFPGRERPGLSLAFFLRHGGRLGSLNTSDPARGEIYHWGKVFSFQFRMERLHSVVSFLVLSKQNIGEIWFLDPEKAHLAGLKWNKEKNQWDLSGLIPDTLPQIAQKCIQGLRKVKALILVKTHSPVQIRVSPHPNGDGKELILKASPWPKGYALCSIWLRRGLLPWLGSADQFFTVEAYQLGSGELLARSRVELRTD